MKALNAMSEIKESLVQVLELAKYEVVSEEAIWGEADEGKKSKLSESRKGELAAIKKVEDALAHQVYLDWRGELLETQLQKVWGRKNN